MKEPVLDIAITGAPLLDRGKVRDVFAAGDKILVVTTDRVFLFEKVWPENVFKNLRASTPDRFWKRPEVKDKNYKALDKGLFRLQLPLLDPTNGEHFATLIFTKDVHREPLSRKTLGRIEHFRHSLHPALENIVQAVRDKHENEQ